MQRRIKILVKDYSPVELGLNIAQNGTEINNMSLEAEFHPY